MSDRPIRVRMAPSPTGPLHIGNARTSLYNYLFARRYGGTFVLRVEDTDAARDTAEYEADILDTLHWLGLSWDEGPQVAGGEDVGPHGPYRQSERSELYAAEADRLLAAGDAYRCYCTPEDLEAMRRGQRERREPPRYDGRCRRLTEEQRRANEAAGRPSVTRFVVRPERIAFDDLIHGNVEFDNSLLGDFVIIRTDGVPIYHFSVVVDDHAMHISHVIRGEDHLSNTPKHVALFRALGYDVPRFGHIPLILNADRSKMSKRLSQTAVSEYRAQGYLPEAMVNFMAFLGWSPGTEEELFTLHELAERFDIAHVQKAGAIFDRDRLDYLNGVYIRSLSDDQLAVRLRPYLPDRCDDETVRRLVPLVKERLQRLSDVRELTGFLFEADATVAAWYGPGDLVPKNRDADDADGALRLAEARLAEVAEADWSAEVLEDHSRMAAEELGWKAGDFFRPLRVAVTGRTVSPPLFDSMELLGHERTLARIAAARERLVREAPVA